MSTPEPTAAAAPADENAPLLDHEYDGIREHDNPLPGWWSAVFVISIVFAVGYWIWFHAGGPGQSEQAGYTHDLADWRATRAAAAPRERVTERMLAEAIGTEATVTRGRALFAQHCVTCHGPAGAGLVGPNLTDDRQIHGATRLELYAIARDGVPAKGMQAWGQLMPRTDLVAVVAFVATLRGTHVAGKAPEGLAVGPFEDAP